MGFNLQEADYGMTAQAFNPAAAGAQNQPGDERLLVKFYLRPHIDRAKSAVEGRPIFNEVDYINIMVPGDKDSVIDRPATEMDKARFAKHYDAYVQKRAMPESGTPLSQWPAITTSQVAELAYFNCRTVEQLAGMSDGNAQKFPGINKLKTMAKDFLAAAKDNAGLTQLNAALEERDVLISSQAASIAELRSIVEELERKSKRGRKGAEDE